MSRFNVEDIDIDYKNIKLLKRCLTENGKIIPARLTRLNCCQQRRMAMAVKRARFLALIPYTVS
jgi:small subunit ribosomal protein S18